MISKKDLRAIHNNTIDLNNEGPLGNFNAVDYVKCYRSGKLFAQFPSYLVNAFFNKFEKKFTVIIKSELSGYISEKKKTLPEHSWEKLKAEAVFYRLNKKGDVIKDSKTGKFKRYPTPATKWD